MQEQSTQPLTPKGIQDLPKDLIYMIATYLKKEDLISCLETCKRWKNILDCTNVWKRCCEYPHFFNKFNKIRLRKEGKDVAVSIEATFLWRRYYEYQVKLWQNWDIGRFKKEDTCLVFGKDVSCLRTHVDDYGHHWLFIILEDSITIWNITGRPYLQCRKVDMSYVGMTVLKKGFLTFTSNLISVFRFEHPNYSLADQYRFIFTMDSILPSDEFINDYYICNMRHAIVDDILVGYSENVSDIQATFLHIWNLDNGEKICLQNVFQQSFVDFVMNSCGSDIRIAFDGGLIVCGGDSGRCLVTIIDNRFNLCQVTLYDLFKLEFIKVIAQLKSRTAWCFMKGDVIAIYHPLQGSNTSEISVYDISGALLGNLPFPYSHNPEHSGDFWFSGSKVILKSNSEVIIWTISGLEVVKHSFEVDNKSSILGFFEPKYLLMYYVADFSEPITVWDICLGVKLWNLGVLKKRNFHAFKNFFNTTEFPNKLICNFKGDVTACMLNFEI